MAYSTVTLTGRRTSPSGRPHRGYVTVEPSVSKIIDGDGNVVLSGRSRVDLVSEADATEATPAGSFSIELPATDDASLNPTGFTYLVRVVLHDGPDDSLTIDLPAAVPVVDLADKIEADPSAPTYTERVNEATEAATAAGESATLAASSATTASTAATTAQAAATEADTSAGEATTAAGQAAASAAGIAVGEPGGVAPLDAAGKLPEANVPERLSEADLSATIGAEVAEQAIPRKSGATQEAATLGPELVTSTGWTLGAGWTGDFATGFTYTYPGSGGLGSLTWTPPFATGTDTYMVEFTIDSVTNSSNFFVTLGGSFRMVMYEGAVGGSWRYSRGIRSVSNGDLVFAPENGGFDGTIKAVSVKKVTTSFEAPYTFEDSTGADALEIRPTKASQSNVLIGEEVGRFNTTGRENVVIGAHAFRASTSGFWNAAVGYKALESNVNGTRNAALGVYALQFNVTGHRNIAIGPFALRGNTHGKGNIGLGADVMWYNETGDYNIALGQAALGEMVSGNSNIAIGLAALAGFDGHNDHIAIGDYSMAFAPGAAQPCVAVGTDTLRNTTGGANVAVGHEALTANTSGTNNVAIGYAAGRSGTTAGSNVAIGAESMRNVVGGRNVAIGFYAMYGAAGASGIRNVVVGDQAGAALSSGSRNTIIGPSAASTLTTGSENILIGFNAQSTTPTDSYVMNIGNLIHGNLNGGRIGIGKPGPSAKLHLAAGVASASGAPLKIEAGTLMTTPEAGAIEFDGTDLYITTSTGTRKKVTAA